jgi:TPP-dependent pyruvate/acetoin dehydrogenase alpha subunit
MAGTAVPRPRTRRRGLDSARAEEYRGWLRQMILIRRFEEKAGEAYSLGKIGGFCHLYIGQEAVAVGSIAALRAEDYITCSYREHGHALARGLSPRAVMAELFGKAAGTSGGKGGSMHLFDASLGFLGGHGIVGVRTYRFMGHSMSDPIHGHYRTREEVEDQRKRDPIAVWSQRLIEEGIMDQAGVKALDKEIVDEVEDAYKFADEAPEPAMEELYTDVYKES